MRTACTAVMLIAMAFTATSCTDNIAPDAQGPSPRAASGGRSSTTWSSYTTSSFGRATIGAVATVPNMNNGASTGSITSTGQYTGSDAQAVLSYGARHADNSIVVPNGQTTGTDGHATQKALCITAIQQGIFENFLANCVSWSGTVRATHNFSLQESCGVYIFGSATYSAYYEIALPLIGPNGELAGYSVQHFGEAIPSSDQQTQGGNGSCETQDSSEPDEYRGSSGGGEGDCAAEDVYMWFHWDPVQQGYVYMGDVCIEGGVIRILSTGGSLRAPFAATHSVSSNGAGQNPRSASHATLVSSTDLPAGSHTLVLRRAGLSRQDVILVTPDATREDLALAIGTLGGLRARDGDALAADVRAVPQGHLASGNGGQSYLAHTQGYLEHLRTAPVGTVPGLGSVQSIDIDLSRVKLGN